MGILYIPTIIICKKKTRFIIGINLSAITTKRCEVTQ